MSHSEEIAKLFQDPDLPSVHVRVANALRGSTDLFPYRPVTFEIEVETRLGRRLFTKHSADDVGALFRDINDCAKSAGYAVPIGFPVIPFEGDMVSRTHNLRLAALRVAIEPRTTSDDPPLEYFHVAVTDGLADWNESLARGELQAFIRGMRAIAQFAGVPLNLPDQY